MGYPTFPVVAHSVCRLRCNRANPKRPKPNSSKLDGSGTDAKKPRISLIQQPDPFDNWDWIYEIKHDCFRALAVIEGEQCRFFSERNIGSPAIKTFEPHW